MKKCGGIFIKSPACPYSKLVNGHHTSTHKYNKPVSLDKDQNRVWHTDRKLLCVCKCNANTNR